MEAWIGRRFTGPHLLACEHQVYGIAHGAVGTLEKDIETIDIVQALMLQCRPDRRKIDAFDHHIDVPRIPNRPIVHGGNPGSHCVPTRNSVGNSGSLECATDAKQPPPNVFHGRDHSIERNVFRVRHPLPFYRTLPDALELAIENRKLEIQDILAARERIASGVVLTPCEESPALSALTGCRVFTKLEYLQRTGSFKDRGARNSLLLLPAEQRRKGVVAASAGNHALALAYHGRDLGIPVTVVMPVFAPLIKQVRCRELGARLILSGANIGEAKLEADKLVASDGLTYIHGFDGHDVIAGQGTIGLEILEQVPDPYAIVVPIGGAGLIAGVSLAVKSLRPQTEIVGIEPDRAASFSAAMEAGSPVQTAIGPTLGDGLAVPAVGPHAFEIARSRVDRVLTVDEASIALSILRLLELEKGVVEGAGAAPLAALIAGKLDDLKGKNVVLILAGGNIDPNVLSRVIEHGLVADGRLAQFNAVISDRPGGLAALAGAIAKVGASVKQITHERAFASADVSTVEVNVVVETRDRSHFQELLSALRADGISCREA